jgi:Transglutaminase-like superfamily
MRTRLERIRALDAGQWRVVATSVVLLAPIQLVLKSRGLKRTAAALAARSDRPRRAADREVATSIAEAVSLVAGRKVVGALCLGRSLLLWYLLRRRGMDAELVVGTKSAVDDQWMAHAWVELDSQPVNDAPNVREFYSSFDLDLPRLRPSSTAGPAERR